jgi:hypothetical protein
MKEPQKQEFSMNIVLIGIIMFAGAIVLSYGFNLIRFEPTVIFSAIKIGLFFGLFFLVIKKIQDKRYAITIGILSGLILFLLPHYLDYTIINTVLLDEGESITLIEYAKHYFETKGSIVPSGTIGSLLNIIIEIIKFGIIVIGPIVISTSIGKKPSSN